MIRVCFRYGDKRLFARVVGWWQGHDSAHCEVSYEWTQLYHDCVSASFVDGGVRGKIIAMPAEKWRIYEVDRVTKTAVKSWLAENDGKGYDVLGLAGFVWRPIKGWLKKKFCSECGAEILGLPDPWRYDVATLESVCARFGRRVQ